MLKMKDNNYINNIAAIRKKQGISQTQFANAIGVETSTISRIETGKSDPSAVTLFAIAKYLQVSVDDLYTRKTTEQIKNEREQEFFKRNISRNLECFAPAFLRVFRGIMPFSEILSGKTVAQVRLRLWGY